MDVVAILVVAVTFGKATSVDVARYVYDDPERCRVALETLWDKVFASWEPVRTQCIVLPRELLGSELRLVPRHDSPD